MSNSMEIPEEKPPKFVVIDNDNVAAAPLANADNYPLYNREESAKRGIIHPGMADTEVLNAYRNLRTSLLPKMEAFNSILLVTSITKGGGASFNAINLATAFTFDRQRTALIVECNFHDPTLAETLGVEPKHGLYDYVSGEIDDIGEMIHPTIVPRLSLVPCGVPSDRDDIEYFTGERMRFFLNEIKNRFEDRLIILDAPPILDSADTTILSELCDYALLVLPYQKVSSNKVEKTLKAIGNNKTLGFVLNK